MPDGKTHDIINITVLIVFISGVYALFSRSYITLPAQYFNIQQISIFAVSYLFGTFFLSPDLDIDSSPYERWGIFRFLWWPYKVIFRHRGLSHHVVFGPLSIFINFTLILVPILLLAGFKTYFIPTDIIPVVVLGIWSSIELHILADLVIPEIY